jgi:hypothetical protein
MNTERLVSHIPKNQSVIDFLYRCIESTDNLYKQHAYRRLINEVSSYWHIIELYDLNIPCNVKSSVKRKINEFLEGFPEVDIIYS